jgi:ribosomal protein S18 acetylase RimI-like enzyme
MRPWKTQKQENFLSSLSRLFGGQIDRAIGLHVMSLQFPVESLAIRPAEVADANWAARLIFAAGPGLFSYVFAAQPDEALTILEQAFVMPQHAFSYEHVQILEVDHQPAGLVLGYPGSLKRKAEDQVRAVMAQIIPVQRVPRILVNLADLTRIKQDVEPQDYYILSLGIDPAFRSKGLGAALLRDTEELARDRHCAYICCDVPYTNRKAQRWLNRHDYHITCSKTSHRFEHMTDAGGLHRMERQL